MFAILFEVLLIEIQEEIHHFAGWEGGGLRGAKIVNKNFVNKLALTAQCAAKCHFEMSWFKMSGLRAPTLFRASGPK